MEQSDQQMCLERFRSIRAEADEAIIKLGGAGKDLPGAQVERIKDSLVEALADLEAGDIGDAMLTIQDAIAHCQNQGG